MALTGRLLSSSYRKDQYDQKSSIGAPATMGVLLNLPAALCIPRPAPANTVANNVTMLSIVELLPTGLNQQSTFYYVADSVATLNTNGT